MWCTYIVHLPSIASVILYSFSIHTVYALMTPLFLFMPVPSPLPSPHRSNGQSGDEVSHAKSVLESVCGTDEIDSDAIVKLCSHVKADSQEQQVLSNFLNSPFINALLKLQLIILSPQELLSLLDQLDKDHQGWVSLEEFVHGLQAVRNSAAVVTFTPSFHTQHGRRRRRHSDTVC